MKLHTTNYTNTFILKADDCPATNGEIPPAKADARTIANIQFELVSKNPYRFTSDDVLFQVYAGKKDLTITEQAQAREAFFSKGQPCLRTSPLARRYGWGIHCNEERKVAMFGCESEQYAKLATDKNLSVVKAMRSKK